MANTLLTTSAFQITRYISVGLTGLGGFILGFYTAVQIPMTVGLMLGVNPIHTDSTVFAMLALAFLLPVPLSILLGRLAWQGRLSRATLYLLWAISAALLSREIYRILT